MRQKGIIVLGITLLIFSSFAIALATGPRQAWQAAYVCATGQSTCVQAFNAYKGNLCGEDQEVHLIGCNFSHDDQGQLLVCASPIGEGVWCDCYYSCIAKKSNGGSK